MSWQERAACKGVDTNIFYPADRGPYDFEQIDFYCGTCPVQRDCLNYALNNNIQHGVWGGLSTKQRRIIFRRMKVALQ